MSEQAKRWRVSDVVKALCEERGLKWRDDDGDSSRVDGDAEYVVNRAREAAMIILLVSTAVLVPSAAVAWALTRGAR
ncbi:MAG: hypothetical protein IPK80_02615 [Nannocystis sp.]|nr:hypothetical protein [Nannocystis sp.]